MSRPASAQTRTAAAPSAAAEEGTLRFSLLNLALLVGGLAAIAAGFASLGGGSVAAAPLLLVLGFAVLVPLGIIL